MLTVGIPKEIKPLERRVGLTPDGVHRLSREGIQVFVEKGAGLGSGFGDEDYLQSGAQLVHDPKTLYQGSDLIQKVKEPISPEYDFLRKGHVLFCFLHLASPEHRELVQLLVKSHVTAMGYETVETHGQVPLLAPMSEIAGGLSAAYAALFRQLPLVQKGTVVYPENFQQQLESVARRYPLCPEHLDIGNVIIFGGGVAGQKALDFSLGMKGRVTLIEKESWKRDMLKDKWKKETDRFRIIAPFELEEKTLRDADVFIGCAHRPGQRADHVISMEGLQRTGLQKKKILMDVAIDQGGNFPDSHVTSYEDPLYLDASGNLRFSVTNIPSLCGKGASEAVTKVTLPYTLAMAKNFEKALQEFPELEKAINISGGRIVHPAVKEAHVF